MLDELSEITYSWSKSYIVEIVHYMFACMILLEDFPELRGRAYRPMLSTVHTCN